MALPRIGTRRCIGRRSCRPWSVRRSFARPPASPRPCSSSQAPASSSPCSAPASSAPACHAIPDASSSRSPPSPAGRPMRSPQPAAPIPPTGRGGRANRATAPPSTAGRVASKAAATRLTARVHASSARRRSSRPPAARSFFPCSSERRRPRPRTIGQDEQQRPPAPDRSGSRSCIREQAAATR